MDILLNIRRDLVVKSLLANAKTKDELNAILSKKETYALVVDGLCRIAENDGDFIYAAHPRIKELEKFIHEKFDMAENYTLGEKEEFVLEYLKPFLNLSSKVVYSKKSEYEYSCLSYLGLSVEENSYKNFIQLVKKEFDILVSQYYTDDLQSRIYLERSPSFLLMSNELIRSYGANLPSELLAYMEVIIKGGTKDRLLDHMYNKSYKKLQTKTLNNIRRVQGIIEENKVLSK